MKRSTERTLTTHAGRLPNPANIAEIMEARAGGDQEKFDALVTAGITELVRKQIDLKNDLHSDGEFWKARDRIYYNSRSTGIEMKPVTAGQPPSIVSFQQERRMPEFREFYEVYNANGNIPQCRASPSHPKRSGELSPAPWNTGDKGRSSTRSKWSKLG